MKRDWPTYVISRLADQLIDEFPEKSLVELVRSVRECVSQVPTAASHEDLMRCCRDFLHGRMAVRPARRMRQKVTMKKRGGRRKQATLRSRRGSPFRKRVSGSRR